MNNATKNEIKNNIVAINNSFNAMLEDKVLSSELIKNEFESIKILVDYCEKLVLNGDKAIEEL